MAPAANWDRSREDELTPLDEPTVIVRSLSTGSLTLRKGKAAIALPSLIFGHGSRDGGGSVPMALSSSGQYLAVASAFTVQIWDLKSGQLYHELEGHRRPINSVCLSQYALRLLPGSADRHICIWSVISGDLLHHTPAGWDDEVVHALYSPDSKAFATAHSTEIIKFYDAPSGELIHCTFQHPFSKIECGAYSPGGQYLAAFGCAGVLPMGSYLRGHARERSPRTCS